MTSFDCKIEGTSASIAVDRDALVVGGRSVAFVGYRITLRLRALPPVDLRALGKRTDEFLLDLDRARKDLATRTAEAFAGLSDTLRGFAAPDGWAVGRDEAGQWWGALRAAVA